MAVCQDLANQIRFSTEYQDLMKDLGQSPGKYINPEVGSIFQAGWTSDVQILFRKLVSTHVVVSLSCRVAAWLDGAESW